MLGGCRLLRKATLTLGSVLRKVPSWTSEPVGFPACSRRLPWLLATSWDLRISREEIGHGANGAEISGKTFFGVGGGRVERRTGRTPTAPHLEGSIMLRHPSAQMDSTVVSECDSRCIPLLGLVCSGHQLKANPHPEPQLEGR